MVVTSIVTFLSLMVRVFGEPLIRHYSPEHVDRIERFLTIALIICIAVFIDRLGRRFYWEGHVKRRRGRETPRLLQDLVTILIVAMSVAIGLWWQEGLTLTGIAATSIGVAAAIGVALQPDIQDVFSGLAMNYEDTCRIGDWITIQIPDQPDIIGRVSGLSWRSAFLTMEDGSRASVPNHIFTSNPVLNHSRPRGAKQLEVQMGVDIRVPAERVVDMLRGEAFKAARANGLSREPAPEVLLTRINSDSGIYTVRFWYFPDLIMATPAKSIMLLALQKVLLQNELPMPVTQIEMTPPPDVAAFDAGAQPAMPSVVDPPRSIDELRARVAEVLAREKVPGVAIALVGRDGPIWIGGVGVADEQTGAPVTADTVFRAASITKMFVALGVMRRALPAEGREDFPFAEPVTPAADAGPTEQLANWTGRTRP